MLPQDFLALALELCFDCALFLVQFLVHLNLTLLYVLGLLVSCLFIAFELQLVDLLLMLQLESLLYLLLHILENKIAVELGLPKLVLGVDLQFFTLCLHFLSDLDPQGLATLIVSIFVLISQLLELGPFLLELHLQLCLDPLKLAFLLLLEGSLGVIDVRS